MALRFCMVTTFYPPYHFGGDGVFVYRLSELLAGQGHRVDVVHSVDAYRLAHPAEPEVAFTHHPNVTVHRLETRRPSLSALAAHQLGRPGVYRKRLREILQGGRYDVIHYHNVSLMGAPAVLGMGSAAVKLYTTHEYWLVCPTHVLFKFDREACARRQCLACTLHSKRPPQAWRYTGAVRRGLGHVDCLLVPSKFAIERHREAGIDRPMVHLPHFVPEVQEQGGEVSGEGPGDGPDEGSYFLYVGRLEKLKGVQDLIRLFAGYRAARLLIVGEGTYGGALREQAKDLAHVKFLGKVHPSELAGLYRGAVAVLVPSLCYETFGLTAAEALTHGTPAIVRRIGALTEIVEQSGGGFAFGDMTECRDAMERLRSDGLRRREMGRRGRGAAAGLWSPASHLEQYLGIVERFSGSQSAVSRRAFPALTGP